MDFDLKVFFEQPPRFREDVKAYMHDLAARFVHRVCQHMDALKIDRLLPRHVSLIIFQMCRDPITRYTRHGLSLQTLRVKTMSKVFAKVLQETEVAIENKEKYGLIDKRIVKGTKDIIEHNGLKTNNAANVLVAACVAEMCGIMLNDARRDDQKTITLEMLHETATVHVLSNGEACSNVSLIRLITSFQRPLAREIKPVKPDPEKGERNVKRRTDDKSTEKRQRTLEEKSVKFSVHRPGTPEHCFWEED